jgi:hypothetical protein
MAPPNAIVAVIAAAMMSLRIDRTSLRLSTPPESHPLADVASQFSRQSSGSAAGWRPHSDA